MGEFNVNKTTGGLDPTAGMYETYPAEQVMMSNGETSVEEAVGEVKTGLNNKVDIYGGGVVNANVSVDLLLPSAASCYLLFTYADNPNIYGSAYMLQFTFDGTWVAIELGKGNALGITVTGGNNKVTVANSTGFNCYYQVVKIAQQ